ncbi:MAG: aldehyde dehydrogenase family protein [bacterium]|nr:aldehyde dehydrogenase family protein [bacterium]
MDCWINGKNEAGQGEATTVRAPWSGDVIAEYRQASPEQIARSLDIATTLFPVFSRSPAYERRDCLQRVVKALTEQQELFAHTIAVEAGKPIRDARGEVLRAIATFQLAVEEAIRFANGEYLSLDHTPMAKGRSAIVRRFPQGVVLGITPFNFPLNLVAHKVAPSLAIGAPIVLKPAPQTVRTALLLARIVTEAGFPAGALQVVPCAGETIEPFVTDERVKHITFTGSALVGWKLKRLTFDRPVTLELGGNGAVLIDETADIERTVKRCLIGGYSYAGQVCISVQRIYVVESVFARFVELFKSGVQALQLGDPLNESSDLSCLISESAAIRVESWISEAINQGAKAVCLGKRTGNQLLPTFLTHVPETCSLAEEEVFGPVTFANPVSDWNDGLDAINYSRYGLQAGYFTRDMQRVLAAFQRLEVGGVIADDIPTFRSDSTPYGGVKNSGVGREGVRYAMEEMSEIRVLTLPSP